jgi:S1-C subfamily serine protease
MVGDILVGINGSPVENHDTLMGSLGGETVGKPIAIEVIRGGEPRTVTVTVGERS